MANREPEIFNSERRTVNSQWSTVFRRFTIAGSLFTVHCLLFNVLSLRNYVLHRLLSAAAKVPAGTPAVSAEMPTGAHHPAVLHIVACGGAGAFYFTAAGFHFTFGGVVV